MKNSYALKKEQKETIGLLSIGTLLEYFDLMLYIHMAVILNELFFPSGDRHVENLISAFGFCSTYLIRPIGALFFGYIGDNIGRKSTVVLTTFMMATSCIVMANLPTYSEIGITASILMTICRILQSLSSMGEVMGASIYLTETIKPPHQYPIVFLVASFSALGGVLALGVANFVTAYSLDWRKAFWAGAFIAFIGFVARAKLRETPEFIEAKLKRQVAHSQSLENLSSERQIAGESEVVSKIIATKSSDNTWKSCLALFALQCYFPIIFYFVYMYCGNILKHDFGYNSNQVIHHNFLLSIIHLISLFVCTFILYRVHPFRLMRWILFMAVISVVVGNYFLNVISSGNELFWIQAALIVFSPHDAPASPIIYRTFPVLRRFTYVSVVYAMSRAITFVVMAYGLIYIMKFFGSLGLSIITLPAMIAFFFALRFFERLDQNQKLKKLKTGI